MVTKKSPLANFEVSFVYNFKLESDKTTSIGNGGTMYSGRTEGL